METAIALILLAGLYLYTAFNILFKYFAFFIIIVACIFLSNLFNVSILGALWIFNLIGILLILLIKKTNPDTKFF